LFFGKITTISKSLRELCQEKMNYAKFSIYGLLSKPPLIRGVEFSAHRDQRPERAMHIRFNGTVRKVSDTASHHSIENFEKKEFSQNRLNSVRKLRLFQSLLDNFAKKDELCKVIYIYFE